jgi:hypothetical protein
LCSVALVTVTPPTNTGSRRATGRDRPGAADLHVDAEQAGRHLLGRVLVGHRPARLAGDEAELLLAGRESTL